MILYLFLACGEVKSTDTSSDDIFSGEWTSQTTRDRLNEISSAICTQLSSCCSERSQEIYFYSYLSNVNLEDFHGQLPPNQTLSQEQCEELLPQMLDITWAGSWMKAIERGEVEFLAEEYTTCLNELQTSTCGEELTKSIFDSTCFGFSAPGGGEHQRSFLKRFQKENDACTPISDGFGGMFYGTCDESQAFCCIDTEYGCSPYPTLDSQGTCTPASKEGEACSTQEPIQLCASGFTCSIDTSTCSPDSNVTLQVGDTCYDPSIYELTGDCENSWCDLFGSAQCEPLIENGEECVYGESCISGVCDADLLVCVESTFCIGE